MDSLCSVYMLLFLLAVKRCTKQAGGCEPVTVTSDVIGSGSAALVG